MNLLDNLKQLLVWLGLHWQLIAGLTLFLVTIFGAGGAFQNYRQNQAQVIKDLNSKVSDLKVAVDALQQREIFEPSKFVNADTIADIRLKLDTLEEWTKLDPSNFVSADEFSNATYSIVVPIGTIVAYFGKESSDELRKRGWLECKGQVVPDDCTHLKNWLSDDSVYEVSKVDGKVCVPDLRGAFLRGMNDGSNRDPQLDRKLGSFQGDAFKAHSHKETTAKNMDKWVPGGGPIELYGSSSSDTSETGEEETRPKNIAVRFLIKCS